MNLLIILGEVGRVTQIYFILCRLLQIASRKMQLPVSPLEALCPSSVQQQNLLRYLSLHFHLNCEMLGYVFAKREFLGSVFSLTQHQLFPNTLLFWFAHFTGFSRQHFLGITLKLSFNLSSKMKWELCLLFNMVSCSFHVVPQLATTSEICSNAMTNLLLLAKEGHLAGRALKTLRNALPK